MKDMQAKVAEAMYHQCHSRGFAAPVDVLMDISVLDKARYDDWCMGRVPFLEAVCTANLHKLSEIMKEIRSCAARTGLKSSVSSYRHKGKALRFSKTSNPKIEEAYATHYVMEGEGMSECRAWSEGDPILEEYHDNEWCKINHDDDFQFMMLCLEGASVGLSWAIIMHKKEAYCAAFHDFKIDACAMMTDAELEKQRANPGIIRNRGKIYSVRKNARVVQQIQKEFGSFDAYLWSFVDGEYGVQIDGRWKTVAETPTISDISIAMSKDMKKRGIAFVGPVITYSFLQAIGIVNDHLADCEYR